jgi:hypothetical protein
LSWAGSRRDRWLSANGLHTRPAGDRALRSIGDGALRGRRPKSHRFSDQKTSQGSANICSTNLGIKPILHSLPLQAITHPHLVRVRSNEGSCSLLRNRKPASNARVEPARVLPSGFGWRISGLFRSPGCECIVTASSWHRLTVVTVSSRRRRLVVIWPLVVVGPSSPRRRSVVMASSLRRHGGAVRTGVAQSCDFPVASVIGTDEPAL